MFRKSRIFFMFTIFLCCVLTLPAFSQVTAASRIKRSSGVTAGDVIVVMKDAQTASSSSVSVSDTARISAQTARVSSLASSVNAKVAKTYPVLSGISGNKIFAMVHSDTKSEKDLLDELRANPDVLGASLNYKVFAMTTPNDPYYTNGNLWGLKAIKADKIWDKGYTGSTSAYAAIIDTGIVSSHEDLSANFSSGRGFVGSSTSYSDGNGHGTHVAGTIAGVGNNSKGVIGISWSSKIIALKAMGNDGAGTVDDVIEALNYVANLTNSTNIAAVNLSLGYYADYTPAQAVSTNDPTYLAFKALSDKNKAVICIAAGNENIKIGEPLASDLYVDGYLMGYKGNYCYPASFRNIDNMIVVAAANNNSSYTRASFSNYSTTYVDVAAPGVGIVSTYTNNGYASADGTSMATPHVAGAAVLLRSIVPSATASQLKNAIIQGANKSYATNYTKYGFLDVEGALNVLLGSNSGSESGSGSESESESESGSGTTDILTINGSFSSEGKTRTAYSSSVTASGGSSYSFSYSGTLPTGLKLYYSGSTVTLSGTPTAAGTYSFTLNASSNGSSVSKTFTVKITSDKLYFDGTFKGWVVGKSYTDTVTIGGGTKPYKLTYSGTLPTGLRLTISGTTLKLSGKPTKAGRFTFKVKLTDNKKATLTKSFSVTIAAAPAFSGTFTTSGSVGKSYTSSISITGGTKPYTVTYSGSVPTGLTLTLSGTKIKLSGTPAKKGSFRFTLKLTDNNGVTVTKSFTVKIIQLTVSGSLSSGTVNKTYSGTVSVSGGTSPYTCSRSGSLPTGLKLTFSGTRAKITGKPTRAGTFSFTLKFTDKNKIVTSKAFSVNIASAGSKAKSRSKTMAMQETGMTVKGISAPDNIAHIGIIDYSPVINNHGSGLYVAPEKIAFKISDDNIFEPEDGKDEKDEDLFTVRADEPLTFIIENYQDLSDVVVFYDFEPLELKFKDELEISDEGAFTLPAGLVHDDFVVSVRARINDKDAESDEIYITAQ